MAKENKSVFVLTLPMKTTISNEKALDKYFELSRRYYNAILGKLLKRTKLMQESKEYNRLRKLPKENKERKNGFKELEKKYGLKGTSLNKLITSLRVNEFKDLGSHITIKLQLRASRAIEKMRYGNAERVNFVRYNEMTSIESSDNKQGIKFRDNIVIFNKLKIPVRLKENDVYAHSALRNNIRFCRILRKEINGKIKYYVQITLEGVPPTKITKQGELKGSLGEGRVGIDIGTRTIAYSSKYDVKLLELCSEINNIDREIKLLQRKMDRSRRSVNPNKFNDNGTINTSNRDRWIYSNHYMKLKSKRKELYRKQTEIRKQSHFKLVNQLLVLGDEFYVETMNFNGLAKRAKNTTINEKTGKFNKKKRFGKSLANKAPSMLMTMLDNKLKWYNLRLQEINTYTCKASQYNHFTDEYNQKDLSERWNDDINIQRDLYSSFLIMNVNEDLKSINRELCIETYDNFKILHDKEINRLKELKLNGNKLISSMGI